MADKFGLDKNDFPSYEAYRKEYNKLWKEANPDKVIAKAKRFREANPERIKAMRKKHYEANKEKIIAKKMAYHHSNREEILSNKKAYYKANKENEKARNKTWREANREKAKAYNKAWSQSNKGLRTATAAKRHSAKLKRTPAWADLEAIKQFYIDCPEGYEVDHIIPLQGKLVSGLHILENLQYLTRSENARKRNKFDIEDQ